MRSVCKSVYTIEGRGVICFLRSICPLSIHVSCLETSVLMALILVNLYNMGYLFLLLSHPLHNTLL